MIRMTQRFCATSTLLFFAAFATLAYADGRNYTDGPVVNVSAIKTVDGHSTRYPNTIEDRADAALAAVFMKPKNAPA